MPYRFPGVTTPSIHFLSFECLLSISPLHDVLLVRRQHQPICRRSRSLLPSYDAVSDRSRLYSSASAGALLTSGRGKIQQEKGGIGQRDGETTLSKADGFAVFSFVVGVCFTRGEVEKKASFIELQGMSREHLKRGRASPVVMNCFSSCSGRL